MTELRLRPFRAEDEAQAFAAQANLESSEMAFLLDFRETDTWRTYLDRREANRRGEQLPDGAGWVASTLLAAVVDGELVGRVSIRHQLNDWLAKFGGHVGYAVIPSARRRGYGTEIPARR